MTTSNRCKNKYKTDPTYLAHQLGTWLWFQFTRDQFHNSAALIKYKFNSGAYPRSLRKVLGYAPLLNLYLFSAAQWWNQSPVNWNQRRVPNRMKLCLKLFLLIKSSLIIVTKPLLTIINDKNQKLKNPKSKTSHSHQTPDLSAIITKNRLTLYICRRVNDDFCGERNDKQGNWTRGSLNQSQILNQLSKRGVG